MNIKKIKKHTVKGLHGHVYRGTSSLGFKELCIPANEAARNDYDWHEIQAREKVSLEWKVCMWCWKENPKDTLKDIKNKVFAYECDLGKCSYWEKVKTTNKGFKLWKKK